MSKTVSLEDHLLQIMALQPGKFTAKTLVAGDGTMSQGTGFPASRVRKALGFLYGRGFLCVDSVVDGQEVWRLANATERIHT